MIRVREILALEPLAEFKLLAGAGGLDHMLNNVTILDYETDSMDFSAFQKNMKKNITVFLLSIFEQSDPFFLMQHLTSLL